MPSFLKCKKPARWDIKLEFRLVSNLVTRFWMRQAIEYDGREIKDRKRRLNKLFLFPTPSRVYPKKCNKGEGFKGSLPHQQSVKGK